MAKVMSLQQALKFFLLLILAMVVLYGGGALSDRLVASQSAGIRWLGVAAAIVSLLPWLGFIMRPTSFLPTLPVATGIWALAVGVTTLYDRARQ